MSNIIALAAIASSATDDGTWVNDSFEAVVKNVKPGQPPADGKKAKPSKCVLVDHKDPNSILAACWFGGQFGKFEDRIIRVSGKGTKVSLYGGKAEVNIGKDAKVEDLGPAPAQMGPGAPTPAPSGGSGQGPAPSKPPVDPTTYFHREMGKKGLLWGHSYQYAQNTEAKVMPKGEKLPDDIFQALVSTLFISADRQGLLQHVPKLREYGDDDLPLRYVPPQPDPAAVEKERLRKEAEAEAQRKAAEAEEAARKAREAAAHNQNHPQENLDEDVPF